MNRTPMTTAKTLITTALLLALGACVDDESISDSLGLDTEDNNNQEIGVTPKPDGVTPEPDDIGDTVDTTQFSIESMINGSSAPEYKSFWKCADVGEADPDKWWAMRFYSDANGTYNGGGSEIGYTWNNTGNNIDMVWTGDDRSFRYADIAFSAPGVFVAKFEITNAPTDSVNCELLDPDGNPVHGENTQTQTNDTDVRPDNNAGSDTEALLNNGASASQETSFWGCENSNELLILNFFSDSSGIIADDESSFVISSWFVDSSGSVQFVIEGNSSSIATPQFNGQNDFSSTSLTIGGDEFGSISCARYVANS